MYQPPSPCADGADSDMLMRGGRGTGGVDGTAEADGLGLGGAAMPCSVVVSRKASWLHFPAGSRRMLTLVNADTAVTRVPALGLRKVAARRPSA